MESYRQTTTTTATATTTTLYDFGSTSWAHDGESTRMGHYYNDAMLVVSPAPNYNLEDDDLQMELERYIKSTHAAIIRQTEPVLLDTNENALQHRKQNSSIVFDDMACWTQPTLLVRVESFDSFKMYRRKGIRKNSEERSTLKINASESNKSTKRLKLSMLTT